MSKRNSYYKLLIKAVFSLLLLELLSFLALALYFEEKFNLEIIQEYDLNDWQKNKITELTQDSMDFRNFDPFLGWENRSDEKVTDDQNDDTITYTINSSGFRGSREYPKKKASGNLRVLALGGSFVFGSEVDDSQCWPRILEGFSSKLEVLNSGVAGYGLDQSFLSFPHLSREWKPDKVIICYMTMHLQRHVSTFRPFGNSRAIPYTKPRFLLERNELVLAPNPLNSKEEYLNLVANPNEVIPKLGINDYYYIRERGRVWDDYGNFVRLLSLAVNRLSVKGRVEEFYKDGYYNTNCEAFRVTDKLLKRFVDEVKKTGADPTLIILPTRTDLTRITEAEGFKVYDPLLQSLDRNGMPYLDMASTFEDGC